MADAAIEKQAAPRSRSLFRRGDTEHLARWQLVAFGLPALPLAAMVGPVGNFLAPFYTSEFGITLTTWGLILGATRILDMATDPITGMICDRLPSRWGRRRHWIVISTPLVMIACAMLFTPRFFTQNVTFWYVLVALILFNFATTIQGLNSTAWGGELSSRYEERSRIMGWRSLLGSGAGLLAYGVPAVMEWIVPSATLGDKLGVLMWFAVTLMPITTLIAVISVGEKPPEDVDERQRKSFTFAEILSTLKRMVSNKYLLWLVSVDVLRGIPYALKGALYVFYVSYILKAPHLAASTFLVVTGSILITTPIWMRVARGREKHQIVAFGIIMFGLSQATMLFWGPNDLIPFMIFTFINGAMAGGPGFLMQSIMVDVVDSDTAISGKQQTGAFFAVLETTTKLAPTLAIIALFPLLELSGFDPTGKNNTPESLSTLRYMFALAPAVPVVFAGILLWRFPLGSKRQGELRAEIEAGRPDAPP